MSKQTTPPSERDESDGSTMDTRDASDGSENRSDSSGLSEGSSYVTQSTEDTEDSSMGSIQQIVDALQDQLKEYKNMLDTTKARMTKQISMLELTNRELKKKIQEKDDNLLKAADAIKSMVNDMKVMGNEKKQLQEEALKDKEDLAVLYKKLGQMENSTGGGAGLNELEVSLVLKLERNQVVTAEVVKKNVDEQRHELKMQIELMEKNLLEVKSEKLSMQRTIDELNERLKAGERTEKLFLQAKEELLQAQKDKNTLEHTVEELNGRLKSASKNRRKTLSIRGESENEAEKETGLQTVEADRLVALLNNKKPKKMFDSALYEELNKPHSGPPQPAVFAPFQAQCMAKMKNVIQTFTTKAKLPEPVDVSTDLYTKPAVAQLFDQYIRKEKKDLVPYHEIVKDIIAYATKYTKQPTLTIRSNSALARGTRTDSTSIGGSTRSQGSKRPVAQSPGASTSPTLSDYSTLVSRLMQPNVTDDGSTTVGSLDTTTPSFVLSVLASTQLENDRTNLWTFSNTATMTGTVSVYETIEDKKPRKTIDINSTITAVLAHNERVFVGTKDSHVVIFSGETLERLSEVEIPHATGDVIGIQKYGKSIVVFTEDKYFCAIHSRTLKIKKVQKLGGQINITAAAIANNVIWAGTSIGLYLFNLKMPNKAEQVRTVAQRVVTQLLPVFGSIWCLQDQELRVVDEQTRDVKAIIPAFSVQRLRLVGKEVWMVGNDGSVSIYDAQTTQPIQVESFNHRVTDITPHYFHKVNAVYGETTQWLCVSVGEFDGFESIQTNYHYHQWNMANPQEQHTCSSCSRIFRKDGMVCRHCHTLFFCPKCTELQRPKRATCSSICCKKIVA